MHDDYPQDPDVEWFRQEMSEYNEGRSNMAWPEIIIMADQDGGFTVAELDRTMCVTGDDADVPVYKYKEYYHSLRSAAHSLGLKEGTLMTIKGEKTDVENNRLPRK